MKFGSIRDVAARAEHLQGEQRDAQNEVNSAQRASDDAVRHHAALMNQLRSLPEDAGDGARAALQSQIAQAETEFRAAQSDLAAAEARVEAVNREMESVADDAREYLQSVEGNIEAAQGAAKASSYGSSAIASLVSGFQQNKAIAERVLQMLNQPGAAGGGASLGGSASGQGIVGKGIALGDSDESVLHIHGNETLRKVDFLASTKQGYRSYQANGETMTCYNTPGETGQRLNYDQGNAVHGFRGDCGVVSCENVARLAGKQVTEADVLTVAANHGLCDIVVGDSDSSGGLTVEGVRDLLGCIGIDAHIDSNTSKENIAAAVESGKGVILPVDVATFWDGSSCSGGHAVTVTSVERNSRGDVTAFYFCDSGSGNNDYARKVDARRVCSSILPGAGMIATNGAIR